MKQLKSNFKRLPGPVRWAIVGAVTLASIGLVTAQFDFLWETSPRSHLGDFLVGMLALGAVVGAVKWWRLVGFTRVTGLEPSWLLYLIRRRREDRRREAAITELRGGPHPRATRDDRPNR